MRKTTATALILVAMMLPVGSASETVSEDYTGTAGFRVLGEGIVLMCPSGCFGIPLTEGFGGAHMEGDGSYQNAVVGAEDDHWGSDVGLSACFWNSGWDDVCSEASGFGCGTVPLTMSTHDGDMIFVWVYTLMATEDLEVCGGTAGTVSATLG